MSIEKTESLIDKLLFECGVSKDDLNNVTKSINDLTTKAKIDALATPVVKRERPKERIHKYIDMSIFKTKEQKMQYVLLEMFKYTSMDFIKEMKEEEWIEISYSRPYKDNIGGPVVLCGKKITPKSSKDVKCGRERFGEINNNFPIYNLIVKLKIRYATWIEESEESKNVETQLKQVDIDNA